MEREGVYLSEYIHSCTDGLVPPLSGWYQGNTGKRTRRLLCVSLRVTLRWLQVGCGHQIKTNNVAAVILAYSIAQLLCCRAPGGLGRREPSVLHAAL